MALLIRRFALAIAVATACVGCYDPELRDCTVTCKAPTDCASGQTCGHDGFCVGSAADVCSIESDHPDAAPPPPPPPQTVQLQLTVVGRGSVIVDDAAAMTCPTAGSDAACAYAITANTAHRLVAMSLDPKAFVVWTGACTGTSTACMITPAANTIVGATFQGM